MQRVRKAGKKIPEGKAEEITYSADKKIQEERAEETKVRVAMHPVAATKKILQLRFPHWMWRAVPKGSRSE